MRCGVGVAAVVWLVAASAASQSTAPEGVEATNGEVEAPTGEREVPSDEFAAPSDPPTEPGAAAVVQGGPDSPSELDEDPSSEAAETSGGARVLDLSDPTMSAAMPGVAPELAPPTLDLVAASFAVSTEGTRVTAAASPLRLLAPPYPFLSQVSLRLTADSGSRTWGGGITFGHNSGREALSRQFDVPSECGRQFHDRIRELTSEVSAILDQEGIVWPTRQSPEEDSAYLARLVDVLPPAREPAARADLDRAQDRRAACIATSYRAFAVEAAFRGAFAINLSFAANFFAYVEEPAVVDPMTMVASDPTQELMRDWSTTLSGAIFLVPDLAMWLNVAFSRRRPDAATAQMDSRLGVGFTIAGNIPFGPPNTEGFRPGLALGIAGTYTRCVEDEGTMGAACREKLDGYPEQLRVRDLVQVVPFIDVRIDTKLQLRIALSVDAMVLDRAVSGTEAVANDVVVRVLPTLSLTTSSWGF